MAAKDSKRDDNCCGNDSEDLMLPIRKHIRCSCLVPGQDVGIGTGLGMSPGTPWLGSAALPVPMAGTGPHRTPVGAGMGMLGRVRGCEAGSPSGAVCLVLPPAACQL